MAVLPTEFNLQSEARRLVVTWDDGRVDTFSLRYLRGWCPCAHCQGHFIREKKFITRSDPKLRDIEPVGGYAARFHWTDGHDSGIYSFDYLRQIALEPPGEGPTNDALLTEP